MRIISPNFIDEVRLIHTIKTHIAKGDQAKNKAEQHYIAAGQHLKTLKAAHDGRGGTWADWEALLKERVGLGKSRASELIQIADGTKTVEQIRESGAERKAKERAILSVTSRRENAGDPEASADKRRQVFAALGESDDAELAEIERREVGDDEVNKFIREALEFLASYSNKFQDWRETAKISGRGKQALAHTLHQCANELSVLAQEVEGFTAPYANDDGLDIPEYLKRVAP